ncbi:MAG TPA: ATP-binding protein [Steroidobacteraceae bacterium]|nr:ATP-binding protein [Steroidobacteraceae bacterium]
MTDSTEAEARYRQLFDTLIEGFCTIEVNFDEHGKAVDYRFLEVNPAFEKHTGIQNAQGRLMREIAPDIESHWFETFGRVALTGESVRFENEAKPLGRHYEVNAYRVGDSASRRVAILFNDITERKFSERKLRAQFERMSLLHQITRAVGERQDMPSIFQVVIRTLEDQLPIDFGCVCLYDAVANDVMVATVGLRSAELAMELALTEQSHMNIGDDCVAKAVRGQLIYEPDTTLVQSPFPQRLAKGALRAMVAVPMLIEGKVFGVLVAARRESHSFSSGECEFLTQLSEQVALAAQHAQLYSARQAAYEDLRQTQATAMQQERLRALGQMASGIAHDINNAISPISLYTEALLEREKNLSSTGRGQLNVIQRAISDVAQTVARMREFYRPRDRELMLQRVQLNELVQQVVDLTRTHWADTPQKLGVMIELRKQLAKSPPPVMGVDSEIREALTNLVFNAVDAMPKGGTLTVRTLVDDGRVHVEVIDSGVGMDEDSKRRCLEPFFTTKGERGTGLGLAMVYGMVQRHGADITIQSEVGRGTTVRLSFSAAVVDTPVPTPAPLVVPAGLRILLVDDDPILLKSLSDALAADGHTIVTANGGREGIETFREAHEAKETFSAVVTDLGMPYVDGRQVANAVKSISPGAPVILLTGWGQRLQAEGDLPAHVDMVLAKPPRIRELHEALARCCVKASAALPSSAPHPGS